jgi:hypothetical protein
MLFDVTDLAVGTLLTAAPGAIFTVKLKLKLSVIPLAPLTVTVAVYVPTASSCLGLTVKLRLPFLAMLASEREDDVPDGDTISKLSAFVSAIVSIPVACVPALFTLTESAVLAP